MPKLPRLSRLRAVKTGRALLALALPAVLAGCNMVVMNPSGDVALQQRNLVLIATGLMLLIIIPVLSLIALFAWRYRHTNTDAEYQPDWDHSTQLELAIWGAPLLIVICLGAVTWTGTHLLDPYRPIERLAAGRPIPANTKPLDVQVVALDWKWLFIYPEYGFATVNELAAPVDRPIRFSLTSSSVMNAFYVPALAGMIYAMPSMETKLHAVINKTGNYDGFSANYSGAGFSGMRFRFLGLSNAEFAGWVARNQAAAGTLDRARYQVLEKPTEKVPVMRFGKVDPKLFTVVVNNCVKPGTTCMSDMMSMDGSHSAGMEHMPNAGKPQGKVQEEPLTGADAGKAPPTDHSASGKRTNSSPANPNTL